MTRFLSQLSALWKQLGLNQKISLVLAAGVVVAVMAGLLAWSSRPDMQLLYGRLDPKDGADIVAALEAQGVSYQVGAGGTSIHVPRADVHRARMDLASKGLPTGGSVGFEIFDRGNFGISDFVQRTNYLRAIQGELSRTIGQLDGVRFARVMVVMPENRLLVTNSNRRSTASVLVDTGGSRLAADAVNSIRSLVANAVEGLRIDDVVVVDNRGNVLSEELQHDGIGGGLTAGQIRYRKNLEDYFGRKVETMLATVLGPANAVVRVSVDVDNSSSTVVEERFDPDAQILRSSTVTEDSNVSSETRPSGAVGVIANVPGGTGAGDNTADPVSNSQQTRKSKSEAYEIGRSTTNTVRNAGEIRRITAAVFVALRTSVGGGQRTPQPRTPEQVETLRQMVVNALGVVPKGGQTLDQIVTVQEVDFASDPVAEKVEVIGRDVQFQQWIELAQKVIVVLLAAGAFLYFLRLIKRGQAEAPSLEIYQPGASSQTPRGAEIDAPITPEMLNEMIRQKPGNVGLTLKEWMSAGQK
ncbi:MAG TPA: flagellar basal-body MS-ring/collar protein FliF [Opitutaceae bacterium]